MVWMDSFIKGFLFSLSLCFDLGLVNVAIIKTGMERGFKPSFMIGFGSCFGDLTYLALSLAGLAVVFQIAAVRWVLWIAGTLVLVFLTYKMLRESLRPKILDSSRVSATSRSAAGDFRFGVAAALSSPTAILWFAAVAGPIAAGGGMGSGAGTAAFVGGFFAGGLAWSLFVATVSSRSGKLLGNAFVRGVSLVSAGLFLYFAVRVFLDGLHMAVK